MKITKEIFRQLIVGKLIAHIPVCEIFKKESEPEIKKAQQIAKEIIEFAEEHNLFNKEIL